MKRAQELKNSLVPASGASAIEHHHQNIFKPRLVERVGSAYLRRGLSRIPPLSLIKAIGLLAAIQPPARPQVIQGRSSSLRARNEGYERALIWGERKRHTEQLVESVAHELFSHC